MPLLSRRRKPSQALAVQNRPMPQRYDRMSVEMSDLEREVPVGYGRSNGNGGGLTAAGMLVKHNQPSLLRRLIQPWQIRSLGYYDIVPEINYAAQFYSRSIAALELFVAYRDPETGEMMPTDNEAAQAALARIADPGGTGRSGLLAAYGRLMFLTGETYLFVSQDANGLEQWEMLSTDELRIIDGSYTRFQAPPLPATTFRPASDDDYVPVSDDTAVAYRLWRRHPRYSSLPDATMKAALDVCVAGGTMVSTPTGARRVEDVRAGDDVYAWRNGEMVIRPATAAGSTGENETVKIVAGRRTLRCTPEHRLLVYNRDHPGKGYRATTTTRWVRARDLRRGDALVVADRIPTQPAGWNLPDGTPGTPDLAYLLGQVTGDGHVTKWSVQVSTFNVARDDDLARIVRDVWGLEPHRRGFGTISWNSVALVRLMTLLGLRCPAPAKTVPPLVWQMPDDDKRAFLRGYEDADGHVTPRGWQSHATSSVRLAHELRHLYLELGENVSNVHVQARPVEGMVIAGNHVRTVAAFPLHRFQVYYGSNRRGAVNLLKTAAQRREVGDAFTIARVKHVEQAEPCETFDLTVPDADCFIADGVVAHNCEELVLLTQAVRARARSRIANSGILFIDQRITAKPMEAVPDEDPQFDPFVAALTQAITAPIVDEGTAAAMVPLIARVNVPDGASLTDLVHLLRVTEPTQQGFYAEVGLRSECIRRLAIGLDMPPEMLLGITDSNHWSAWMVDEQVWKAHLQPLCQQLVDDLTSAYLAPYLRDEFGVVDWQNYCVAYDATAIINHPDRTKDAKDLFDRAAIGHASLREAAGFDDHDAPTEEERAEIIGIRTRDSSLAWYGVPGVRSGGIEPSPGVVVKPGQEQVGVPVEETGASSTNEPGPPSSGPPTGADGAGNEVVGSADPNVITGCATLGLLRAREVAGARLRNAVRRDDAAASRINGVENRDACFALGRDGVRAAARGVTDAQLVEQARPLLVDAIVAGGADPQVAQLVADTVVRHAARTLYDRDVTLPAGFAQYVGGLLRAATTNGHR